MVAREGFVYEQKTTVRHTKCGRMRGMVVGEGGRSSGVLLYYVEKLIKMCIPIDSSQVDSMSM